MGETVGSLLLAAIKTGRRPVRAVLGLGRSRPQVSIPAERVLYRDAKMVVVAPPPDCEFESGTLLVKENHLVARPINADFVHFMAEMSALGGKDASFLPVIFLSGILLNGNFVRIPLDGGHFRDLDNPTSFAATLALEGLDLFIAHPAYASRLQERYVERKLGIKNPFLDELNFDGLMQNLQLYIDFVVRQTGCPRVVLLVYSLGGMEAHAYQAIFRDERVAGMIVLSSPVLLLDQPTIKHLRLYNFLAGLLPATPVDPLRILGRNFKHVAKAAGAIPEKLLPYLPVLKELYDFEHMEKQELAALVHMLDYATEAITDGMLRQLVEVMAGQRRFISADGAIDYFDEMRQITTPALYITGENDTLAPPENVRLAFDRIGTPFPQKRIEIIPGAGHFLTLKEQPMKQVARLTMDFMQGQGRRC